MRVRQDERSRDTMSQWPVQVERPDQIPDNFSEALDAAFGTDWPYSVYIPTNSWDDDGKRPKVFSMTDEGLACFEDMKTEVKHLFYPYEDIVFIEFGRMLLSSWVTVHGMVDGDYSQFTVSYRTVQEDLLEPVIDRVRKRISPEEAMLQGQNGERLSDLKNLDKKFLSYTKQSLLPDEKIINIIFQPGTRESGGLPMNDLPDHTHAVVLTDNELILIKEDNHRYRNIHSNHGVVRDFIPLQHVTDLIAEPLDKAYRMRVQVEDTDELDVHFAEAQVEKLTRLIEKFKKLMH